MNDTVNTDTNPQPVLPIVVDPPEGHGLRIAVQDAVSAAGTFSGPQGSGAWAATLLPDSGNRTTLYGGAVRDRAPGKGRFDLLSPFALKELAVHAEKGAGDMPGAKYPPRNWERGYDLSTCLDSAMRHLNDLMTGDDSENHAAAAMWNMMAFIHIRELIRRGHLPAELAEGYVGHHLLNPVTGGRTGEDDV